MSPYMIRIPETVYSGIKALVSLSDEPFQELMSALTNTAPVFYAREFTAHVASKVSLDAEDVNKILTFILPLYGLRFDMGVSIPEFNDIFLAAATNLPPDILPSEESERILAQRLSALLNLEKPLGLISKAQVITNEHSRILTDSHIYTELRPIFGDNPDDPPVAGVILHKLKINYVEGDDRKEFFVTLDANDIETLRKALDRAEKKARSLRTLLDSTSMEILETPSNE